MFSRLGCKLLKRWKVEDKDRDAKGIWILEEFDLQVGLSIAIYLSIFQPSIEITADEY